MHSRPLHRDCPSQSANLEDGAARLRRGRSEELPRRGPRASKPGSAAHQRALVRVNTRDYPMKLLKREAKGCCESVLQDMRLVSNYSRERILGKHLCYGCSCNAVRKRNLQEANRIFKLDPGVGKGEESWAHPKSLRQAIGSLHCDGAREHGFLQRLLGLGL